MNYSDNEATSVNRSKSPENNYSGGEEANRHKSRSPNKSRSKANANKSKRFQKQKSSEDPQLMYPFIAKDIHIK